MRYIGARYVPKFMGVYDPTQEYENMCVVDNGSGTSYISTKIVPPGTPLTDGEYWALYGAASGAIISLQDQINDINDNIKATYKTPEMYGAVGDGTTDDRQAFIDMIADSTDNTTFICTSDDGYYLSDSIAITGKNDLIFENGKFILDDHVSPSWFRISNASGIIFRGCYFEHSSQIIHLFNCSDIFIENCVFNDCGYCIIQETGYISDNVNVANNRFYDCRQTPIECNCGVGYTSKNWIITGNIAVNPENQSGASEHCFVTITAVDNVVIDGNIAENFRGHGIIQLERASENIIVSNNVLRNCAGVAFINCTDLGKHCVIANNKIYQGYSTNTYFLYIGNRSDAVNAKFIIEGNHCVGNGTAPAMYMSLSATDVKTWTPVLVSGNIFENFNNLFPTGIQLYLAKFVNNIFKSVGVCLDFSTASGDPTRVLSYCAFVGNKFIGSVTMDMNYAGGRPQHLIFESNEFNGDVSFTRCDETFISNNVLYDDAVWSFSAGTHTVQTNNYKYGVGILT